MKQDEAVKALQAVGLKADATKFFGNKVRQQQPAAGQTAEQGSTVKILVSFSRAPAPPAYRCADPDQGRPGQGRAPLHRRRRREGRAGLRGNPRGWRLTPGNPEQDALFTAGCTDRGILSFIHTPYLVNVGSPTEATVEQSIASIAHNLARGARARLRGRRRARRLRGRRGPVRGGPAPVARAAAAGAGRPARRRRPGCSSSRQRAAGRSLAATVEDLGPYFAALDDHPLVGVCFDTCHAWAAGHDLAAPGGMTATLDALRATVGPGRLGLVHANDSLDECGSKRDRHTTIGAGSIGVAAVRRAAGPPVDGRRPGGRRDAQRARRVAVRGPCAGHRAAPLAASRTAPQPPETGTSRRVTRRRGHQPLIAPSS